MRVSGMTGAKATSRPPNPHPISATSTSFRNGGTLFSASTFTISFGVVSEAVKKAG